jgi:TP901 family phage tail tape measure protein
VSEVHRASSSLQQLQRELLASNRAISASTKLANNLFRDTLTGSGQFSSHFVNLNSDVDKFGKNLDSGRLKLKNYFQTFREHATTQKGMIRELAKEQVMLQNSVLQPLGRNAQGLMQYNVMIPRGLDAVKNSAQLARMELQIMNRALSEGAGSLINWGKNTQWAGRQLTVGLTVPLTMFGAAAGKAFREADQELVRLTKVYGGLAATSATDLKAIREEVVQTAKSLSQTMGASFKDTIALGADIAATGKMGNDLLGSIEETTRLAILGEVDRQDAMKATLSIQTAFKQNTQQLTESINFLNAVENQTSTTLNDLVEAIPKAGPVIQQLGGSIEDLALYMTAMREGGINASEGANALKSGLASLINPTKQTVGIMSDFGIDVMGMVAKNTGDTTGMLLDLQKALNTLDPLSKARALEQMFGKFQFARMSALLNNLGKEGSQTLQVMDLMKASTSDLAGIAERELGMITESASGKYRKAMESLKAELASVGEEFLGVATKLINAASKILNFFTELPTPIKKALTFMAGFTALVGPLIMLTGVLANFFGYITKGIVQLRSFFMKANGWKMLTPEIIAAQKAAEMVENAFYSDAAAAQVLHNALQKLVLDYQNLQAASMKSAVPVNAGVSTVAGNAIVAPAHGRRVVDPNDPYVGDLNTRAMSHIRPRDPNNPATLFGGVPGAIPVNRGISRTPQIYMHDRLPNVEGLTSVKGISTGIVAPEAAKFHALMATLGMQTEQEVANLKKTIAMGGTVSRELLDTFDDILPITQRFADSAATQSALIVQQMRNAEITVDQAKARILALNAQIEADMGSAVSTYAAGRGRTIDLTRAPMMDQPVVDANGQFTLRDLYKKKTNAAVMEEFGRVRGVRTFGAPYSIQTTRMPKFNIGGDIESFGPNKTVVSGPSSVDYDDRLGSVPLGGYVLNQQAAMDPANAPLVAMAPSTYLNDGGNITAALTPREVVFGPQIQRMPELYAAVDAANSGYNFGGQIMNGISGYGKKTDKTPSSKMDERLFKKQYKEYLRFINNPRYEDDLRIRMIMLDAAELAGTAGMPVDEAIKKATSNFDKAKMMSGGSDEEFVKIRIKQVQNLEKKYPKLRVKKAKTAQSSTSNALNYKLNDVRDAMMDKNRFPNFVGVKDLIEAVSPTTFKNKDGMPIIQGLHERAHFRRRKDLGYMTSGYMGLAAVLPPGINNIMSRLEGIGLSRDVLNLNAADARENFELALKRTGMDKFTTVDDLYAAVQDDGKFKTKSEIESGRVVRATKEQKNSLRMFLEAAAKRQRWLPTRPPRLVMGGYNLGGMIPGGSISRGRSNYGNIAPALRLLAPDKQLKILAKARELSSRGSLGKFADMPVTEYGHQISASTGMSYPVPGVSGLYKVGNKKVFVKGVPNELTAVHEPIGTQIARDLFGIHSPVQTARTVANPVDPTKKTKLLALESDYDPRFANTNVPWDEDTVLRQLANSLLLNNKDLSRANVYGNFNPDVGQAGVLPKASGNTRLATADEMNSMEKQAMINLLAVKGGARKDFARDTAPIISKMSPKKYGRRMKKILEDARPKLLKIINDLPVDLRPPYQAMLKRLDDGIEVDWSQYHAVHANPKYLNAGGPVGGGPIKPGRRAYGRKDGSRRPGNPAARANWEAEQRAQRERDLLAERSRASSRQITGQQALTTGLGREAVRTGTTSFYNPGQVMVNNMIDPFRNSLMMKSRYLEAAFNMTATAATKGATTLAYGLMTSHKHIGKAYQEAAMSLMSTGKKASGMIRNGLDSINNFGTRVVDGGLRFRNAIVQEQNAFAARNYPPGMAPVQGLFGPGMIGQYRDVAEGVQSRKVGVLGRRKTEYLVNNEATGGQSVVMNKAQAQASGVSIPQRANGISMGAQMGIGMAGSMGGMALMGKEKVGGMSGMTAGMLLMGATSILPMLPYVRILASVKSGASAAKAAITGVTGAGAKAAAVVAQILRFAKAFSLVGAAISAAFAAFKIYQNYKDSQQDASMGLSMTAKAAEQAGIKYFDLNAEMKATIENRKLLSAAGKGGEGLSVGLPGIAMSVKEMKTAKEEGKKLKDFIESLNRSEGFDETLRLVSNQKAQFIAAGMSVEDANKKIYGALANSERSGDTFKLLADKTFAGISDKATAATFAVGNLINTLNKGPGSVDFAKEVGEGFEGLINIFDLTTKSLVGTKDAFGNVIDQFDAYKQVMTDFGKVYGDSLRKPIGEEAYNDLARSNMLLGEITTKADTVEGILAKWTLFSSGFAADLSKIDSDLAVKLASFTTSIQSGITDLADAGGVATTFATVETAMDRLRATINKNSAASQRAANAAQRNSQEELKAIAKKIKLIDEEKNKKLEALRATQDASNYALQLQKLQIEYADAVSRGDMAAANQAKLDIDQLTLNRQTDLAQKAIEDAANKAKAPLEKDAQKIQDAADKRSTSAAIAADNASAAQEIAATLEKYQKQYSDLTVEAINVKLLPPEQQAAAQKEVDRKIFALIKEVQKSGTGNSLLAKTVRDGFGKYFDENGKALKLQQTSVEYNGSTLTEVKTVNKKILDIFTADANSALKQAELITGKVTLKQLRDDVVAALLRYRPNTPEGTAENQVNQPGTAKDYSAQKTLGSAGAQAAKPPTLGGSAEKYTRVNNDGMEETFTVFTYKNKSYVVDSGGNIYKYDYSAQTVIDLDKKPVGKARATGGVVKHFEPGGKVSGPGTSTSDSIPAMLSDGEYVIKASSVAKYGVEAMDNINAGRFANGGQVQKFSTGGQALLKEIGKDPTLRDIKSPLGTSKRFIDTAISQLGITEEKGASPDGQGNNVNKYTRWLDSIKNLGTKAFAWCGTFVNWVASMSGVKIPDTFYTEQGAKNFASLKQLVDVSTRIPTKIDLGSSKSPNNPEPMPTYDDYNVMYNSDTGEWTGNPKNIKGYKEAFDKWFKKENAYEIQLEKDKKKNIESGWSRVLQNPPKPGDILYLNWAMQSAQSDTNRIRHAAIATSVSKGKSLSGDEEFQISTIDGNVSDSVGYRGYSLNKRMMEENPLVAYARPDFIPSPLTAIEDAISAAINKRPTYLADKDQTVEEIAKNLNIDLKALLKSNPDYLAGNKIYKGTRINIPKMFAEGGMVEAFGEGGGPSFPSWPKKKKKFKYPGLGLDKDPMRYAGSGASTGGIGNGAYGLGPLMFANGGLVQGFKFGGFADKFKNLMKFGAKGGIKGFGMGAKSGAAYQAMEEAEKFLSLKYGANENASGLEKWGKSVARFGWSALQGGVTGAASGGGLGFVGGSLAGTVEGLIGLIKGGSQFGVKGGKAYDEEKLWKRGDLNGLNDKYFNSDYAPDINKIAKKDLANMSLTSSLKNVATTAGLSAILPYSSMLLRTAADKTAVARQGVRVFDKRLPKFVNDLMELNFIKPTKYLDRVNKTLSEYQEKAMATAGEIPEILAGKGVVNLYGPRRYASAMMDDIPTPRELYEFGPKGQLSNMFNTIKDKATAFLYPADRGINYSAQVRLSDNNVRMPIHRSESSPTSTLRALLSLYGGKASDIGLIQSRQGTMHSGSPNTLFHELGHRNLNILGGPEAIANRSMSNRNWHGTHEGFADIFQDDAYRLLQGSKNAKLTNRLGVGDTYSTTSGNTILEDMVWRLSGGLGKDRLHQMGTEFLVPYTNMIKDRVPADTLKRLQDMARIEGPNLQSREAVKSLYDMITQNIPKFEYGINSVPADMLALIHKNEAVIPANMNPFNPNATAAATGSVYNINVELNGTNVTAKDVALEIRNEMRLKEMAAGVNRKVGP